MKYLTALMTALALSCCISAAEAKDAPKALQDLGEAGGQITFMGHAYGVDGWLLVNKARTDRKIAYTTPEGGIIVGVLLGPDGSNQTNKQILTLRTIREGGQASLPGADSKSASSDKVEKIYAAVEKAHWIGVGQHDAPYLYMFVNTTCPHCQQLWKNLQGAIRRGKLQVRLVPFGNLDENRGTGAALLSAADPAGAWNAFIGGDKSALDPGLAAAGALQEMDDNTALFNRWKMPGPPFTMYRRPRDGKIMAISGVPDNTMMVLADLMRKEG